MKKKAVFALSQLPKDEGVPKLMEVARTNRNPEVRKQAMFWLGQTHDPRAVEVLRGDPAQEMRLRCTACSPEVAVALRIRAALGLGLCALGLILHVAADDGSGSSRG